MFLLNDCKNTIKLKLILTVYKLIYSHDAVSSANNCNLILQFIFIHHSQINHKCIFFDAKYTRMLRTVLNKSRKQHPSKQQLYGHLPTVTRLSKLD